MEKSPIRQPVLSQLADGNERLVSKGALDSAVTQLVQSHVKFHAFSKMNRMILCIYSQAILLAGGNERLVSKGALHNAVTQLVQSHVKLDAFGEMNRMILCTYSQAILMSRMILCTYSQAILVNCTRWLVVLLMQS